MKKRILLLLTVVALMVVMMAASVTPAFADKPHYNCTHTTGGYIVNFNSIQEAKQFKREGLGTCRQIHHHRNSDAPPR